MLLAVDPGASSGWALFDVGSRVLVRAGVARPVLRFAGVDRIAIEIPQAYPDERVPFGDLVKVAVIAGRWIGAHPEAQVAAYFPRDWKGQLPKAIGNQRTLGELSESECAVIEYPRDAKGRTDVLDAIGIGLVHLGRLRRGLV